MKQAFPCSSTDLQSAAMRGMVSSSMGPEKQPTRSTRAERRSRPQAAIPEELLTRRKDVSDAYQADPVLRTEQLAQTKRAALWETPQLQTVLRLMRYRPDLWSQVQPYLKEANTYRIAGTDVLTSQINPRTEVIGARLRDYVTQIDSPEQEAVREAEPRERHRDYTPLLAALYANPDIEPLIRQAVSDVLQEESDFHRANIKNGTEKRVQWAIRGAGVAAANLGSEMFANNPNDVPIAYEQSASVAGPFGGKGRAWRLNSRTRSFTSDPDAPNLPGTPAPLNTTGRRAPLQQADITGDRYGWQTTLASAIEATIAFSLPVMTEQEIIELRPNKAVPGEITVVSRHLPTGEIYTQNVDGFIDTGGLGPEKVAFQRTETFEQIYQTAQREFAKGAGGDPRYLSYDQFMRRSTNPEISLPLKGYEEVGVAGGSDGGATVIEKLLKEPETPATIARPKTIYWFGVKAGTKRQFQEQSRPRYAEGGVDFPRTDAFVSYDATIVPLGKALSLEQEGGSLRVRCEAYELAPDGTVQIDSATGKPKIKGTTSVRIDHFIDAVGFDGSRSREIFAHLFNTTYDDLRDISANIGSAIQQEGSLITFADGSRFEIAHVTRNDETTLACQCVVKDEQGREVTKFSYSLEGKAKEIFTRGLLEMGIRTLETRGKIPERSDDELLFTKQGKPFARKIQAGPYRLYEVGTVARIAVSEAEKGSSVAFELAGENVDAVWRNGPNAQELGKMLSQLDREEGIDRGGIALLYAKREALTLPPLRSAEKATPYGILVAEEIARIAQASRLVNELLLQYVVGTQLYAYQFPKDLEQVTFTVKRIATEVPNNRGFLIKTTPAFPQKEEYRELVQTLFSHPLLQRAICRGTSMVRAGKVTLEVPIQDGLVDPARIRWNVAKVPAPRRREKPEKT